MSVAFMILLAACQEEVTVQERKEQEQRYFNLYLASNYPGATEEPEGYYYLENRAGTGDSPGEEEWMLVNHVGYKIPEDDVFVSYVKNVAEDNNLDSEGSAMYGPYKMQNGSVNKGFTLGVSRMREGGRATLLFTSDLGYGEAGNSKIPAFTSLKYEIELLEVIPDIDAYEQGKIDAYMDTVTNADTIVDEGTGAVIYYMVDDPTDGQLIVADSAITLAYTGMLLDGRIFDSKDAEDPYKFVMGEVDHIVGWDLALPMLREGEKARLVIPYPLAYGILGKTSSSTGLRVIPPYETLLFEIEVLQVGGNADENNHLPVEQ